VIAFYAVAKLVGGGHAFEVMSDGQVIAIRDASQGWQQAMRTKKTAASPWGAHYAEMGRKTVLRRLFKYLPVSIEIAQAAALDDMSVRGESQALDNVLDGEYVFAASGDETPEPTQIGFDVSAALAFIAECTSADALGLYLDDVRSQAPDEYQDQLAEAGRARLESLEG
jgi:recombination protein RecT